MKKFPWPAGGSTCTTDSSTQQRKEDQQDEWERLPMEVIQNVCFPLVTDCLLLTNLLFPGLYFSDDSKVTLFFIVSLAGSGSSIHPDQSDPQSSSSAEEAGPNRAASVVPEDGGSAAGLFLPAAAGPEHGDQSVGQHGQNLSLTSSSGFITQSVRFRPWG